MIFFHETLRFILSLTTNEICIFNFESIEYQLIENYFFIENLAA